METKAKKYLLQPVQKIPVIAEADVVVAGGGPSGVCAAVAAARHGASTILIEKNGYFGGACTAGLVNVWHSLYSMDKSEKVIGGLVDDAIGALKKRNAIKDMGNYSVVDTEAVKLVFDEFILNAGVVALFHTYVVGALSEEVGSIQAMLVENKSGRGAIKGKVYIDCTGDGDLAYQAGAEYEKGNKNGAVQPPGLCVRLGLLRPKEAEVALKNGKVAATLAEHPMDYNNQPYTAHFYATPSLYRNDERMFTAARIVKTDCSDAFELSRAEIDGRRQIDWFVKTLRIKVPGFENIYIMDIAAEVAPRETRRFLGDYILTEKDILSGRQFQDVIAQGAQQVDIHNPTSGGVVFKYLDGSMISIDRTGKKTKAMWTADGKRKDTQYYQIPYRVLLPRNMQNLMVAGRCISATHEALGATRVMVNCMQLGQAAGIGAAIASSKNRSPREIDLSMLQEGLRTSGAPIGLV